jgi:hypothetical protein
MSPNPNHSRFGGSNAHRWKHCPASAHLPQIEGKTGAAGVEGDRLHKLAECLLRDRGFKAKPSDVALVQQYVTYCNTIVAADTYVEHRVYLPSVHSEAFGTMDFIAWDSKSKILWVVDLKTGKHRVDAANNDQLLFGAVGVEDTLDIKPNEYRLVIHQHGVADIWTPDAAEVANARFEMATAAASAETSEPVVGDWCHWCKVQECPAKAAAKKAAESLVNW